MYHITGLSLENGGTPRKIVHPRKMRFAVRRAVHGVPDKGEMEIYWP
jgi:hypothetical protein